MQILSKPCGAYGTNCYVIINDAQAVVIDPGDGAFDWIASQKFAVKAILNTHGHFDHVANNAELVLRFNCPLYAPKDDIFMLARPNGFARSDQFATPVLPDSSVQIGDFGEFIFHHYPGHTPGCSLIEWQNEYFSGDFLFANTIGRCDFEYSDPLQMRRSLQKAQKALKPARNLRPGHGLGIKSENIIAQISEFLAWF